MHAIHKIGWMFTASLIVGLVLIILVQDGMFLDGVTYSCISKNLANNIGTFWKPHYTKTLYADFYEHPPLVFGIQSLFFKLLGNGIYAERIYSFLMMLLTLLGIVLNWKLFTVDNKLNNYSWLPVLFWITTPTVFWSFRNNMLENTLSVFTVFSVYLILKAVINHSKWLLLLLTAALGILLSFLTKGLVGLFPLATVVMYWLVFRNIKFSKAIGYSFILLLFFAILCWLLTLLQPAAVINIQNYFNKQLLPSLNNNREITTTVRFKIIFKLLLEVLIPLLFAGFVLAKNKVKKNKVQLLNKMGLLFVLMGLAASLPLSIVLKQRTYYLVPAIPYFAIGLAAFIAPYVKEKMEHIRDSILQRLKKGLGLALALCIGICIFLTGRIGRDKEVLHDVYLLAQTLPQGTIISIPNELYAEWGLIAYMARIGYLSLICNETQDYFLIEANKINTLKLPDNFKELSIGLVKYKIYKKETMDTSK